LTVAGAGPQGSTYPEDWPGVVCLEIQWTVGPVGDVAALAASRWRKTARLPTS
jgi:hypothetical protein